MSRISVRGIAVASATAVTTVGAVVGVASGSEPTAAASQPVEAADATLLDTITTGHQANAAAASFTEQAQTQMAAATYAKQQAAQEAARQKAADDAAAKRRAQQQAAAQAAEKAAQQQTQAAQNAASAVVQAGNYTIAGIQAMAQQIIGSSAQYQCFSWIVSRESGWDYHAVNPSTGAYGLVQALPGDKMAFAGADWRTNPATQIKWGLSYMDGRYGSPCGAQQFWEANGWY